MKTLFVLSVASGYGGAERSVEIMMRHMPADIRVRIFAGHPEHVRQLRRPGALPPDARLVRIAAPRSRAGKRLAAMRLAADVRRHRPSAIVLNTNASALIAAAAARFVPDLGRRCHLFVRDFLWTDLDHIFGRLAGARVLTPDAVVAERLGYLKPYYIRPLGPSPVAVVPEMVDLPSGPVSYDGPILHLATVNPWKGHADLMVALRHLEPADAPIRVHSAGVTGDKALRGRLLTLRDRLGIEDMFALDDYVPDPTPLLRACRAVVVASVSHSGGPETFGRTIIEAWAHRKPVVAYAAGAPAGLIAHDVDGLLVPEGDVEALASALRRVWSSPQLCKRLGETGYAKAERHHEAGAITRRLLDRLDMGTSSRP